MVREGWSWSSVGSVVRGEKRVWYRGKQKTEELAVLPAATRAWTSHQSGVNPDFGETHPHPTSAPAARLYPPDVDGSVCRSGRLVPVLLLLPLRSPPPRGLRPSASRASGSVWPTLWREGSENPQARWVVTRMGGTEAGLRLLRSPDLNPGPSPLFRPPGACGWS